MNHVMQQSRPNHVAPSAQRRFLFSALLVFATTALLTLTMCKRMANMDGMQLPGGWTMSMMWMRMPGQSWPGILGSFMSMWSLMMVAMMSPVLVPALARYRELNSKSQGTSVELTTVAITGGYFAMWTLAGLAILVVGIVLASLTMQFTAVARVIPFTAGVALIASGLAQLSRWKIARLHCCYHALEGNSSDDVRTAWAKGIQFGRDCVLCCAPLTAMLIVLGMMEVRAMAVVTLATTLERTRTIGRRVAPVTGMLALSYGVWLLAREIP